MTPARWSVRVIFAIGVGLVVVSTDAVGSDPSDPSNAVLYGPVEGASVLHGCDRAAGEVFCGGECVMPDVDADTGKLKCLPPGVREFLDRNGDFAWGAATASYQIEGAVAEDGRGASIWDAFSHTPGKTRNGDTGDVADDHYHKWREDVQLMRGLGLTYYRLSIAWSRIVPDGSGEVNEAGVAFYESLVDALVRAGIKPFVTLYHWDMPQALHDAGGWHSPDPERRQATVDAFVRYAGIVFGRLAPRGVKHWLTFNEPYTFVRQGYSEGNHAPGRCSDRFRCAEGDSWREPYIVGHEVLRAHAHAVALFRARYEPLWGGEIGITLNADWAQPADPVRDGGAGGAAQRYLEAQLGWFADPIKFGDYPASMRLALGGRLPSFSDEDRNLLAGSWDFFGQNFYNAFYVSDATPYELEDPLMPFWSRDLGIVSSGWNPHTGHQIGLRGESTWLFETPGAIRNLLIWVHERYLKTEGDGASPLPLYVTENGCSAPGESEMRLPGVLDDRFRVAFYFEYLTEVAAAVRVVSANNGSAFVKGYFAWSLLDNFEWGDGYHMRFGLHFVDFRSSERTRYAKASAVWYSGLLHTLRSGETERASENALEGATSPAEPMSLFAVGAAVGVVIFVGTAALSQAMAKLHEKAARSAQHQVAATRRPEEGVELTAAGVLALRRGADGSGARASRGATAIAVHLPFRHALGAWSSSRRQYEELP